MRDLKLLSLKKTNCVYAGLCTRKSLASPYPPIHLSIFRLSLPLSPPLSLELINYIIFTLESWHGTLSTSVPNFSFSSFFSPQTFEFWYANTHFNSLLFLFYLNNHVKKIPFWVLFIIFLSFSLLLHFPRKGNY